MKSKSKTFRKPCTITISKKNRKETSVEIFLEECVEPIKRFSFRNTDTFDLVGVYVDIIVEDYENSYS